MYSPSQRGAKPLATNCSMLSTVIQLRAFGFGRDLATVAARSSAGRSSGTGGATGLASAGPRYARGEPYHAVAPDQTPARLLGYRETHIIKNRPATVSLVYVPADHSKFIRIDGLGTPASLIILSTRNVHHRLACSRVRAGVPASTSQLGSCCSRRSVDCAHPAQRRNHHPLPPLGRRAAFRLPASRHARYTRCGMKGMPAVVIPKLRGNCRFLGGAAAGNQAAQLPGDLLGRWAQRTGASRETVHRARPILLRGGALHRTEISGRKPASGICPSGCASSRPSPDSFTPPYATVEYQAGIGPTMPYQKCGHPPGPIQIAGAEIRLPVRQWCRWPTGWPPPR